MGFIIQCISNVLLMKPELLQAFYQIVGTDGQTITAKSQISLMSPLPPSST